MTSKPKKEENNKDDMLRGWLEFLVNPESDYVKELELKYDEFKEAKEELVRLSQDDEERALYEVRAKINKDKIKDLENLEKK